MTFLQRMVAVAALSIIILPVSGPVFAAPAAWSFVGIWKINITGAHCTAAQTVKITTADGTKVRGSTTPDGQSFGKIVSGSFDGTTAKFHNAFYWDGRNQAENWTATLSRNGNFVRGTYVNTNGQQSCRYSGSRAR